MPTTLANWKVEIGRIEVGAPPQQKKAQPSQVWQCVSIVLTMLEALERRIRV
jgi:predicted metalloenzyme YecM